MRIELDDDATAAAEKVSGPLGMSVNAYMNWLAISVSEVSIVEASEVKIVPKDPLQSARPKVFRTRKNWVSKF
jgi:hypothetical protein